MRHITRRTFIRSVSAAGLALPLTAPVLVRAVSPNSKLRHASFGADGMAWSDIKSLTSHKQLELAIVCDIDPRRQEKARAEFPSARYYTDWREVFEKEADHFDSCNVSIPDHMHASVAITALRHKKHLYCQKPLTHDVYEARRLTQEAKQAGGGVVTQMGIQVHSSTQYRLAVKLIQDGTIGKVKRVHLWSNKVHGGTAKRPDRTDPVPAGFDWDAWIGVAPMRPYAEGEYHPKLWRRWVDFGTGNLGDMGCHIFSPVVAALELGTPTSLLSEGDGPGAGGGEQWGVASIIHRTFAPTKHTVNEPIQVTWYDGDAEKSPEIQQALGDFKVPGQGSLMIGTEGVMLLPHIGGPRLFPQDQFKGFDYPDLPPDHHWQQFVDVCLGSRKATLANFDFAGPLTETVLLGNIAARFHGQKLDWDAAGMKFTNHSEANQYVRREYRTGWQIPGLA